jgi:enterochelin esterase-like enzyme
VALHGLGEARKGVEAGAWGWVRDYWLDRAMKRLREPPLTVADFQGFVDRKRLARLNESLVERPFRGLVVACPYTPDLLQEKTLDNAEPFGDFVVDRLLPRVRAEAPVDKRAGLDGVSLGGRVALLVGLARIEAFTAVGSLQAALQVSEARELARRAARARERNPSFPLRLLTSDRDFYRDEIGAFHAALQRQKVAHEHLVLPGPHDYPFNRGPGALEMLLWHDRVLRGEEPG